MLQSVYSMARPERVVRTLVFDLDDTLFPERDYVHSGFRAVGAWLSENHNVQDFADVAIELYNAGRRGRIFDEALTTLGLEAHLNSIQSLVDIYRTHAPSIQLFEDAAWALRRFRSEFAVGILTDGYLVAQQQKVAALGLQEMVNHVLYTDSLGRDHWKPSPLPYRKIMELTNSEGHECVYVGDNPLKDFVAARQLGWTTIHIVRESGEYAHALGPQSHEAHHRVASLYELVRILGLEHTLREPQSPDE